MGKDLDRLESVADKYFESLSNITVLLGKKLSHFNAYKGRSFGQKTLNELKDKLGINPMFITHGEGDMLLTSKFITKETDLNTPGYRLKTWLKKNNKKQVAFAKELGVAPQTISNWINGLNIPDNQHKILEDVGIDLTWLFEGDNTDVNEMPYPTDEELICLIASRFYNRDIPKLAALSGLELEEIVARMNKLINTINDLTKGYNKALGDTLNISRNTKKVKVPVLSPVNKKEQ